MSEVLTSYTPPSDDTDLLDWLNAHPTSGLAKGHSFIHGSCWFVTLNEHPVAHGPTVRDAIKEARAKLGGQKIFQSPAEAPEIGEVTWQQACDAIEDLDDFASMLVGIDPSGQRETLYRFVEQCKRAALANVQPKGTPAGDERTPDQKPTLRSSLQHAQSIMEELLQTSADDIGPSLVEQMRIFLELSDEALSQAPAPAPAHDETAWLLETSGGGHALYWDGGLWIGESPRISGVMQFGLTTTKDASKAVRFVSLALAEAALKSFRADYRVAIGGAGVWKAAEHMWPAVPSPAVEAAPPPGYALIHEDALRAWGKLDEVRAACVYPVTSHRLEAVNPQPPLQPMGNENEP